MEMRECRNLDGLLSHGHGSCPQELIPAPLKLKSDIVIIHIYHMHDADMFGDYYESAVQLLVTLPGTGVSGAYSPYLYLGSLGGSSCRT